MSTRPSQYATKASSFSVTHAETVGSSVDRSGPVTTLKTGPTGTIAVLAIVIRLPWVMLTPIRTSWQATPRGDTQTVIGRPVVAG